MAYGVAREKREEGVMMRERAVEVEERHGTGSSGRAISWGRCVQIITNYYNVLCLLSRMKFHIPVRRGQHCILPEGLRAKALE